LPEGDIVKIEGRNGTGKSNIINSIWVAIGGRNSEPKQPIRKGQEDASIFLDLGDITVHRRFKGDNV